MIGHPAFAVEPWTVRETHLHLDVLAQSESVFALSNGHLGVRGNLDEGEPNALPGSYLNGVYELRPLPYAEAGFGYPESGQTVINVTNGKVIRLLVEDEPFDVRYGELLSHERVLDFRAGTLTRTVRWRSPAGCAVQVRSIRLVSLTQRAILAIRYEVEPIDAPLRIVVQSELVTNEPVPKLTDDPRAAAELRAPLQAELHAGRDKWAALVHATRHSGLRVAAAMDHVVDAPDGALIDNEAEPYLARLTVATTLESGQRFGLTKFVGYGWSERRSIPAVRDQVAAALTGARQAGWDGLVREQRDYLDVFWGRADVEVDGDPQLQQAVRFALFHLMQASARAERRSVPAKGLTGPGYDGHTFWDTETFALRALTYTAPTAVADALRWRHTTLKKAKGRARQLGLGGAAFPWRTINGDECSGYWPAGTAAFHIAADIADAVLRYIDATGDMEFERTTGIELLVETARLWMSLGHIDLSGRFRIDGVTGPDEYSAIEDNNVFTNLMAQRNLEGAIRAVVRNPEEAERLGVTEDEAAHWRVAANTMRVPYDEELRVHPQSDDYTRHQRWDFDATSPDDYPLLLHFPYFDLYRKQVVKQADLVLAMELRGDAFTDAEKARNFRYYEGITVRDSSLSACSQAVIAAEVGYLHLAYDYWAEAALIDLNDLQHNTRDGLHMASLAGAWIVAVNGFGGLRDHGGELRFKPRVPPGVNQLAFTVAIRGTRLRVSITPQTTTYALVDGEAIDLLHDGEPVTLQPGKEVRRPTATVVEQNPPSQPKGREPLYRGRGDG